MDNTTENTKTETIERKHIGVPEGFMALDGAHPSDVYDALHCALSRARSTAILLGTQFDESDGSRCNDNILMNVIWSLEGQLEQAINLADNLTISK